MYSYYLRQVFVHVGGALCGGTILDETTILSAAHCFDDNHVCFMYNISSSQFGTSHDEGRPCPVMQTIVRAGHPEGRLC